MLSYIFVFMIAGSVLCSVILKTSSTLSQSIMDGAEQSVELLIMMCGMMCLWSGVMEVAKEAGLTKKVARLLSPLLRRIFPDVLAGSKAFSLMCMNISANLLGLSNAATPLGLNAMKELKKESKSDKATDSMIMFVVMNTASIQLLPTTLCIMRSTYGSKSPFDITLCVWITSLAALCVGLTIAKVMCKKGDI